MQRKAQYALNNDYRAILNILMVELNNAYLQLWSTFLTGNTSQLKSLHLR